MKIWPFLLCLTSFLVGCSTTSSVAPPPQLGGMSDKSQTFWVGDPTHSTAKKARSACNKDKKEYIDEVALPLDALLTIVTLGMYSQNSSRVYCR